jgi:hypothetical protein
LKETQSLKLQLARDRVPIPKQTGRSYALCHGNPSFQQNSSHHRIIVATKFLSQFRSNLTKWVRTSFRFTVPDSDRLIRLDRSFRRLCTGSSGPSSVALH